MNYKNKFLFGAALLLSLSAVHADSIEWGVLGKGDEVTSPQLVIGDFTHTYEFILADAASVIIKADEFNCQCSKLNIMNKTFRMVLKDYFGNSWVDTDGKSVRVSPHDLAAGRYSVTVTGTGEGQLFAAKDVGIYTVGVSVVPVPGAILLFGSGLVGLGGLFRSNRKAAAS